MAYVVHRDKDGKVKSFRWRHLRQWALYLLRETGREYFLKGLLDREDRGQAKVYLLNGDTIGVYESLRGMRGIDWDIQKAMMCER